MLKIFYKILKTPDSFISIADINADQSEIIEIGKKLNSHVRKLFKGSLAIRQVDAGSDNACEQELTALSNAFYDIDRFGIHFVASPKHADMLLVTGPVSRNMEKALLNAYACTPSPKIVVAVGDDAINGGVFKSSYATWGGVDKVIPVDYQIPGDPPSPKAILKGLLHILQTVDQEK